MLRPWMKSKVKLSQLNFSNFRNSPKVQRSQNEHHSKGLLFGTEIRDGRISRSLVEKGNLGKKFGLHLRNPLPN